MVLVLVAPGIVAQEKAMSMDECINAALFSNYSLKSSYLEAQKAEDMIGTAFDLPKTGITISQDATSGGSMDNGVTFSQEFEFPTVYFARRDALRADNQLQALRVNGQIASVVNDVTLAYCDLIYAARRKEILMEHDSICSQFLRIATIKFENGETSRLEKINAERLYGENQLALNRAENDYINSQLELKRLMGVDYVIAPSDSTTLKFEKPLLPVSLDYSLTEPGKIATQQIAVNEKRLEVAKNELLPDINFGITAQAFFKSFNPYHIERYRFEPGNFMGFEVGVSVPLFFGAQKAKVKAAKRDIEISKAQLADSKANADAQYQALINQYVTESKELDYYEQTGLPEANEMIRIARVSYELGDIGYVEYVQNLETAAEIMLGHAEALNRYNIVITKLNFLQSDKWKNYIGTAF